MDDLYIKDGNDNFIPIKISNVLSKNDLTNKIIVISVEIDNYSYDIVDHIADALQQSKFIKDALTASPNTELLIIPHIIRFELLSRKEAEYKKIYIEINPNETTNIKEIKTQIDKMTRQKSIIIPSSISLQEYEELYNIKEKIKIRKGRNGGGLAK